MTAAGISTGQNDSSNSRDTIAQEPGCTAHEEGVAERCATLAERSELNAEQSGADQSSQAPQPHGSRDTSKKRGEPT